ncbi:MAG: Uma2 family endonuclease [Thermoanaerobaculia bacterium]
MPRDSDIDDAAAPPYPLGGTHGEENGMVQPRSRRSITPEEYLALERRAETRSEYLDGEMFAMAGGSRPHNLIVTNLVRELSTQLMTADCEVYSSDQRVRVPETGLYTYPDVVVACGEPRFEDEQLDTLLNPSFILEVLSASTEAYDRGKKFAQYRTQDSLMEYVLVAQDEPRVEQYVRQEGKWLLSVTAGLEATLALPSVQCTLALDRLYHKVGFPEPVPSGPEERRGAGL